MSNDGEETDEIKFGNVVFTGKDIPPNECKFDKIATGGSGQLYVLQIFAPSQIVKSVRAILNNGAKASISGSGVNLWQASKKDRYDYRGISGLMAEPDGYTSYVARMSYGMAHCLFVTRRPGFMNVVSEDAIWAELNDNRFTTPICREWMPFITKRLKETGLLSECWGHRCESGILDLKTSDLDAIVEEGFTKKLLYIPDPAVIDAEFVPV